MSALRKPDHTPFNKPGTEGSVDGVDEQCYGKPVKIDPPKLSHEHTQHYGQVMYGGDSPVDPGAMNGQIRDEPATGANPLKSQGDQRHKGSGRGNSDPTPAMPGA